jgi:Fe2+ transport system protein FeoA
MKKANGTQQKFKILGFHQNSDLKDRLISLGFQLGVELEIWKQNVFGSGVVVLIHNQLVGLRRSEFDTLKLEPIHDTDSRR